MSQGNNGAIDNDTRCGESNNGETGNGNSRGWDTGKGEATGVTGSPGGCPKADATVVESLGGRLSLLKFVGPSVGEGSTNLAALRSSGFNVYVQDGFRLK